MTHTSCDYDRVVGLADAALDEVRASATSMLRCAARHACDRALVCSDLAIDTLNLMVLGLRDGQTGKGLHTSV